MKIVNFVFFWMLLTFAIGRGDIVGMALACLGFLFFHGIIEDHKDERY
jgi:hypothetical protein